MKDGEREKEPWDNRTHEIKSNLLNEKKNKQKDK